MSIDIPVLLTFQLDLFEGNYIETFFSETCLINSAAFNPFCKERYIQGCVSLYKRDISLTKDVLYVNHLSHQYQIRLALDRK